MAKTPAIPSIDSRIPREIQRVLSPMKQILDQAVAAGLSGGESPFGGMSQEDILAALPDQLSDSNAPPAPYGLVVVGGFATINLQWLGTNYRNHGYTEIWRNAANDIGAAVLIGQTPGELFSGRYRQ